METGRLKEILGKGVLILDGAMGTMIQRLGLKEDHYRGEELSGHPVRLTGCNDVLSVTHPEAIKGIHRAYLEAGADIISTNTFNSNAISLEDYRLNEIPGFIKRLNVASARLARAAAEEAPARRWGGKALVAGSVGPTGKTASMSPEVSDPSYRDITYGQLYEAYREQVEGLIEGGVDVLLFETVFDTLNLKAGLDAANRVMKDMGIEMPIMVSATISDKAGRTLSGQTLAAFATTIEDYDNILSIGLNCGFGPADMMGYIRELGGQTGHYVSAHPNAGLPNALGEYDESPEMFARHLGAILREGCLNIVGGCCGTTPAHIAALRGEIDGAKVRKPEEMRPALRLSGLERVEVVAENNFLNVGERCNVAGSRKFLRLIKEKKYEEALAIAARQVEDGAMVIDINMDDALLDAKEEMVRFLRYISSDPDISKVPIMVDSSDWKVVEAALENIQGKSIVNSISLKEGEEKFLSKARRIRELGAAVIVMAFDEEGQADTYDRKIAVSRRAYRLLTEDAGFKPDDIIFDVNIMAVATGIEEHNRYGIDFIKAVEWIKGNLPGARTSGGVSNLSFAFRGKNTLRESMHAVFLYHAISAGLDMGIVNPATKVTYEDIEPGLRGLLEDVILARRSEAAEELAAYASAEGATDKKEEKEAGRNLDIPVGDRLRQALVKGGSEYLKEDLDEAVAEYGSAVKVIEGPLMDGMNRVGELFGEGKMFLPQVVKTARAMKQAVEHLRPMMEAGQTDGRGHKAGKVVFATVKGDVHDIGKNIVSIVLACNNYEVIDLGVMVPAETIIETVKREKPDILCLSGLITPSLTEMVNVAKSMEESGIKIPIMVGGATTSKLHTALKIAPVYSGTVVHTGDAAQNPVVASKLLNETTREEYADSIASDYEAIRREYEKRDVRVVALQKARAATPGCDWKGYSPFPPAIGIGRPLEVSVPLAEIVPFINWKMFFHAWKISGNYLDGFPYDGCEGCVARWRSGLTSPEREKGEEALRLYKDARRVLEEISDGKEFDGKGIVAFYEAAAKEDVISLKDGGEEVRIPVMRQQQERSGFLSVADFISPHGDIAGVFAVTAGRWIATEAEKMREWGDSYKSLLLQSLSDRIAEASSEWLHREVRRKYWGYAPEENLTIREIKEGRYRGIRPAFGYPMLPDQLLNHTLATLLPLDQIGVRLTENGAMTPSSSVSGIYISSPCSRYFMVGEIGEDQISEYSERRGIPESRVREMLRM